MSTLLTPITAVAALEREYAASVTRLLDALRAFIREGKAPDPSVRARGDFNYPELRVTYLPDGPVPRVSRAFGKFSEAGVYATTIARPSFFKPYLIEQLSLLADDYPIKIEVVRSIAEIPYAYVLEDAPDLDLNDARAEDLARWFPVPSLAFIGDETADGEPFDAGGIKPLALFDAPRVDLSLQRLKHYTGTPYEHVQNYVLFTNYHRYVDAFVEWAVKEVQGDGPYTRFSAPGGIVVDASTDNPVEVIANGPWRRHQMPAYHLMREDGEGVTLVNIGVGPSNAKTITDHLAVLRPQCWIMVGHCGGLRHSQAIGDYVLAHAYLRDDHVLDAVLPPDIPVPPIAEIQLALQAATARVSGATGEELKQRLRTGTVVTTDDRNWEFRFTETAKRFNKSRAIAIDMESATIAANGYRLRVPYGTLLCVSDKPLHGEIKLPGAANLFYQRAISEHIRIGIESLELLKKDSAAALHSRKLRSFDEPPFR
jgi:AMP nucleosidase